MSPMHIRIFVEVHQKFQYRLCSSEREELSAAYEKEDRHLGETEMRTILQSIVERLRNAIRDIA
jgi:hypothetical protein